MILSNPNTDSYDRDHFFVSRTKLNYINKDKKYVYI